MIIESRRLTPIEALRITNQDIVNFLDGLPDQKIHCSVMGAEALEAAVFNWAQHRGVDLRSLGVSIRETDADEGRIVCQCFSLSEPYLRRKIKELGLKTIPEITNALKAGGACMSCHHAPGGLQDLLDDIWGRRDLHTGAESLEKSPGEAHSARSELSPYQMGKRIEQTIDEYIRPMLEADGGGVEVLDIKNDVVYCRLLGACSGCPGASMTLKMMVERILKDSVDERIRVIAVS